MIARYSVPDSVPDYIKGLPEGAQRIFVEVFNETLDKTKDEEQARIAGWGAVKNSYEKQGDVWVRKAGEMQVIRYVSQLSDVIGTASVDPKGGVTSDVQVFRTGVFKHPVYGKFTITEQDLDSMVANFKENRPKPPTELVVDYEHMSATGAQVAPAAGWVKDLFKKAGELLAKVAWTDKAAGMIKANEYRFISPEWHMHYRDKENGKDIGPTLLSIALTNRPFIEGMQPVMLSEALQGQVVPEDKAIALAEWDTAYINELPDKSFAYVEPGDKDAQGKTVPRTNRHLPYRNADGSVNLDHLRNALARIDQTSLSPEAKAQAKTTLDKAAAEAGVGAAGEDQTNKAQEDDMDKQIRDLLGLAPDADIMAAIKDLKSKADMATQAQTAKQASDTALQASEVARTKAEGDLAVVNGKLTAGEVQADVDQALKDGHILPKQVEWAKAMRAKDPTGFKAFIASAPKIGPDGTIKGVESSEDAVQLTETETKLGDKLGVSKDALIAQKKRDAEARKGK
jgi:phage I-like protein/cation transport regulator ChaB